METGRSFTGGTMDSIKRRFAFKMKFQRILQSMKQVLPDNVYSTFVDTTGVLRTLYKKNLETSWKFFTYTTCNLWGSIFLISNRSID